MYSCAGAPRRGRSIRVAAVICGILLLSQGTSGQALVNALFARYTDALRGETGIPGLSAAIVRGGAVDWDSGFGHQDVERAIAATPETPYPVGGLTQSFAAVLLGMCVERGWLNIEAPIRLWAPSFPDGGATVRQVLAHASEPSRTYRFDPSRFAALTTVAQSCLNKPFRVGAADTVLEYLGMAASVPGADLAVTTTEAREFFDAPRLARYGDVIRNLALPYRVDRNGRATRIDLPAAGLDAATGLVSTVRDLARFEIALDELELLQLATLAEAWRPASFGGQSLPTGLGWFVQTYQGERLVWQFSQVSDAYSAIVVKIPARRLTLILLANSNGLTSGVNLEQGDVTASPFVKIFLRLFIA